MRYLKIYEDFKKNNQEGSLITNDDIINCIRNNGIVYATIIKDLQDNNPSKALKPVSIDDDGLVTIQYDDGNEYEVSLKNIEYIEY